MALAHRAGRSHDPGVTDDHGLTRYAAGTYPCPSCLATADLDHGCPGCGLPPDPVAAEVVRLGHLIAKLADREQQLRRAHADARSELDDARTRRDELAALVAAAAHARRPPPPPPPAPAASPEGAAAPAEVSGRTVQTILFVLGGVLLGTGAIVFTAVAWTTFGIAGRAAILAAVTALVLAAPLVAVRRGLRGTAETFAMLGMLLVVLDGYAVWSVDLFGARDIAAATWTGLVCLAAAAVATGYARATRLTGPGYAALVLIQPVLPLLAAELRPDVTGWAYVWAAVAAVDLAVWWRLRGQRPGHRLLAWWLAAAAVAVAVALAAVAALVAGTPAVAAVAGGAVLAAAAPLAVLAWSTGSGVGRAVAAGGAVLAVVLATGRVAVLAAPDRQLLAAAGVVTVAAAAAAGAGRRWPRLHPGARIGGLVATGTVALVTVGAAMVHAAGAVAEAWWRAEPVTPPGWQVPVALVLLVAGVAALVPAGWREVTATGAALAALSAPVAFGLAWWTPVVADLAVAAALGVAAVLTRVARSAVTCAVAAAALSGHALLVGFATTAGTAAVLASLVLLGVAVAVLAATERPEVPAVRPVIGRGFLLVGLLAVPGAAAAALAAAGADRVWPPRAALAATVLLVAAVALARRLAPGFVSTAAAAVHVTTPVAIVGGLAEGPEVVGVYAAGALLVLGALGWLRRPARVLWWLAARAPAAVVVFGATAAPVVLVLLGPYEWLSNVWRGAPSGSGVTATAAATAVSPGGAAAPVALTLVAAAAVLAGRALTGRWAVGIVGGLLVAPAALLVALAELGPPWPVVPAVSLLLGLAALLGAAMPGPGQRLTGTVPELITGYGLVLAGAGLAGALPTRWSTLVGLVAALAVAVLIGLAGRREGARVAGWVAAVALAVLLAVAATRAADLPFTSAALAVLAAAAVALAVSGARRAWRAEAVGLEAASHAAAAVALALSASGAGRAAVVAALWGVAVGLRALWPGEKVRGRAGRAVAAVGVEVLAWWLLLASQQVTTVEAYTVPAAAAAGGVGALVLRARPAVGSWVAFGPALAAGFLPSLYASLVDPMPLRRLLLGAVAVAIVVLGAARRWQAPVLIGGAVVVVVAVRELALVWQLLDAWIPLTAAGLLLVGLAATYERRRRDLARLRHAVRQMT